MIPHDQQRLGKLVSEFIDGCGFEPPLYLVAIGSNGSVSRYTHRGVKQVCAKVSYLWQRAAGHLEPAR